MTLIYIIGWTFFSFNFIIDGIIDMVKDKTFTVIKLIGSSIGSIIGSSLWPLFLIRLIYRTIS